MKIDYPPGYDSICDYLDNMARADPSGFSRSVRAWLGTSGTIEFAEKQFGYDTEEEEEEEEEDTEDEDSWGACCHDTSRIHCSVCSVVGSDITHLVNTIGVIMCGSVNAVDTTADINFVTCEDCITAHEAAVTERYV